MDLVQQLVQLVLAEGGAYLLGMGTFVPLKVGLPLAALALPAILFAPETKPQLTCEGSPRPGRIAEEGAPLLSLSAADTYPKVCFSTLRTRYASVADRFGTLCSHYLLVHSESRHMYLVYLIFFVGVLDRGTFAHALQYMSKQFHWTIAGAGRLLPVVSLFKFASLLLAPWPMAYLRRRGWSPESVNAFIVIFSLFAISIGNLLFALCSTWEVFTAGNAPHLLQGDEVSADELPTSRAFRFRTGLCDGASSALPCHWSRPKDVSSPIVLHHHGDPKHSKVRCWALIFVRICSRIEVEDVGFAVLDSRTRSSGRSISQFALLRVHR